jgi:hypothetical protein
LFSPLIQNLIDEADCLDMLLRRPVMWGAGLAPGARDENDGNILTRLADDAEAAASAIRDGGSTAISAKIDVTSEASGRA